MFTFFVVLTIIGFIGLIVSFIMLVFEHEPFALWVTLICVCGVMLFIGIPCGAAILSEENKDSTTPIIQEEQVENIYQYKYCPYCGKEINQ